MRFSQLGALGVLAGLSHGFLIPPTISSADKEIVNTLPFDTAAPIDGRLVAIECPGCPVYITNLEGQTKVASGDVDSLLRFNFSLERGDKDHLMLNGVQMYPVDLQMMNMLEPLTADQLVKTSDGTWNYAASPRLGYEFAAEHSKTSDNELLDVVDVTITVVQIGGTLIRGFPHIDLKLVETPSGKLMIGDVAIKEATAPTHGGQECSTLICKWRAIIAEKMSKLKGCGRKRPQHGAATEINGSKPIHKGDPRPHPHHRPHGHHGHRHNRGGFAKVVRNIVFHVLLPIMIGVFVGITASLVGMIVGHMVIFIWRILFRRGQRGQYQRVQAEESESNDDEDSKDSPPPVYEDAPAYEEALVEKIQM